jgi:hypothetical protein
MSIRFVRAVHGYSKTTDELVAVRELPADVSLAELQRIFGVAPSDPMYDCYPIGPHQAATLATYVGELDRSTGTEWFLQAYEDKDPP